MSDTVVVRVTEMKVQTKWGKTYMETEPVGEILYAIEVPKKFIKYGEVGLDISEDEALGDSIRTLKIRDNSINEGGTRIFTAEGIQHIFKGLQVALSYQTDKGDF